MNEAKWNDCSYLERKISAFGGLCQSLALCHQQWKFFLESNDPYHLMEKRFTASGRQNLEII